MKRIKLSKNKYALVDDADFEWLNQWKWTISQGPSHQQWVRRTAAGHTISMHRLIMGAESELEIDHKNLNGLDNRRDNLRFANRSQNAANRRKQSNNTSGYKGVSWDKSRKKWFASITVRRVQKNLGRFNNKKDAARAYNTAAKLSFGEFALLNKGVA